jgi:hypothetical protein
LFFLPVVDVFEVYSNNLTGTISPSIAGMDRLLFLRFDGNKFDGQIPSEMALMSDLRMAEFNDNGFTGSMPAEICATTGARELQVLTTDCKADDNGFIENTCTCCTGCCNPDGEDCEEI